MDNALETAIALACDSHRGQKDKAGQPYILHPLRLMLSFELLHEQDNMTLAALDWGFADATHFSHAFHDVGVNPRRCSARSSASTAWSDPYDLLR